MAIPFRSLDAPLLLLFLLVVPSASAATTGVTRPTIVLTRGADPNTLTSTLDPTTFGDNNAFDDTGLNGVCTYDGGTISLLHPMSLKPSDRFFATGQLQLRAIEMMVDEINISPRCGVKVGGKRYGLSLTTYGDDSSKTKVGAIVTNGMLKSESESASVAVLPTPTTPSYWLGPYSSGLTGIMSPHANSTNTVLVAGGAASTPVFRNNPTVFGTFPPTKNYLAQAVRALAEAGAQTAASVWEDASFTRGVCAALPDLAAQHGLTLQSQTEVAAGPTAEHLDPVAATLSEDENDPDVVVTCVYDAGCAEWVSALRRSGWSPRAQVFTVCIGMDTFVAKVGNDAKYMMGISPWDSSLPGVDGLVGWTASDFAQLFTSQTARTATYHAASAAASVGVLVQAMERANSVNPDEVREVLATADEFQTLYGNIGFNDDGQSRAPALVLQYDEDMAVQTVYPPEQKSGGMVYPMPTWDHRDCMTVSTCEVGSGYADAGSCQTDGTCECTADSDAVSVGVGSDASCVFIPPEDMTYVSSALTTVGIVLVAVQALLSLGAAVWTYYFRRRSVVKASQPEFLLLICFGTFLIAAGIIPIGIQGTYRYEQDPVTREETDVPNDDIRRADAACMAFPWLFCLGFVTTFSALFAKIFRIKKIYEGSQRFVRRQVAAKDVAMIMVVLLAITVVILLTWQLVDPLRWERAVITTDGGGYPTKSVGSCQSNNAFHYLIPLTILFGGCLIYALYLCYTTRNVPSDYSEGKWITASIISFLQILVLAIPILVIVENDNNAFYFVRTAIMFLMSATVTLFIFLPKAYKLHFKPDSAQRSSGNRFNFRAETSVGALSRNGGSAGGSAIAEMRERAKLSSHSGVERLPDKSSVEERRSSYDGSVTVSRRPSMASTTADDYRSSIDGDFGKVPRRPSMVKFSPDLENGHGEEETNPLPTYGDGKEHSPEQDGSKNVEGKRTEEEEEKKGANSV